MILLVPDEKSTVNPQGPTPTRRKVHCQSLRDRRRPNEKSAVNPSGTDADQTKSPLSIPSLTCQETRRFSETNLERERETEGEETTSKQSPVAAFVGACLGQMSNSRISRERDNRVSSVADKKSGGKGEEMTRARARQGRRDVAKDSATRSRGHERQREVERSICVGARGPQTHSGSLRNRGKRLFFFATAVRTPRSSCNAEDSFDD